MTIQEIADLIFLRIQENKAELKKTYQATKNDIGYFFVDELLPEDLALGCYNAFPDSNQMRQLKSIREYKHVSAQMDKHSELLEKVIYAFQDEKILQIMADICEIESLEADPNLYAGGISLMKKDNFLNPHLDNSHDAVRKRWRVLNLLYYVSPDWKSNFGGHLELWPNGPKSNPIVIESKFNRLVVMATHATSWHSVNKVEVDYRRCCISNYFFSKNPLKETDKFHVTKFRGRPNQFFTNIILDLDSALRMTIRKFFKKGIRENPHVYKNKKK